MGALFKAKVQGMIFLDFGQLGCASMLQYCVILFLAALISNICAAYDLLLLNKWKDLLSNRENEEAALHLFVLNLSPHPSLLQENEYEQEWNLMKKAFVAESRVRVMKASFGNTVAPGTGWIHLSPVPHDRSCLLPPPVAPERDVSLFPGGDLLVWANRQSGSQRVEDGSETPLGIAIREAVSKQRVNLLHEKLSVKKHGTTSSECLRVSSRTLAHRPDAFLKDIWLRQRPYVITDYFTGIANISAVLERHYEKRVGVKLSDSSDFEGVEPLSSWGDAQQSSSRIPDVVLEQLVAPEKVVVRAAHEEMSLKEALSLMIKSSILRNASVPAPADSNAYIEYQSLAAYKDLMADLLEGWVYSGQRNASYLPSWLATRALSPEAHLWLGDGTTVGRLHFDRPDNILVQVVGKKRFKLFPPEASYILQEGHMREAQLGAMRIKNGRFKSGMRRYTVRRESLMDSTSLVHSPLTVEEAELQGIPLLTCTVSEGEALFVPSFWWHEVASSPSTALFTLHDLHSDQRPASLRLNLAVNFWFEPLFDKAFPCKECKKYFNGKYASMMQALLDDSNNSQSE
jgi:jumonji domain-containing protein 7